MTAEPLVTIMPAAGLVLMTLPAATVELAWGTIWGCNPAAWIVCDAATWS